MNYKPLHDRVIIETQASEETTKSGIIIPDAAKEKPLTGKVIKVGSGRISEEGNIIQLTVKEGDSVVFSKYGGIEIKLKEKDYLIIKESDIIAILED